MIKRYIEKKIVKLIKNFPAVVLLGPRQVGKSTLAKKLGSLITKEAILLDLESSKQLLAIAANPELFLEQHKEQYVILDEVQRFPAIFPLLRPAIDQYRQPTRYLLLGSADLSLLQKTSESLAGRVIYVELYGLNLLEVGTKNLLTLWYKGGFPEPFLIKDDQDMAIWQESFLTTYFERELPMLGLNISPLILRRIFGMLAHFHGGLANINKLSNALGLDRRSIEKAIHFFMGSYLVRELPPFYVNNKKRLIKTAKYYIRDSGLLHHVLHLPDLNTLLKHPSLGASWEGFIIEQIASLGLNFQLYFYRTRSGAECDLVLVRGNQPIVCIEAKANENPKLTKSFSTSVADLQTEHNFIVTPSTVYAYPLGNDKVTVCGLHWLMNYLKDQFS